MSNNYKFTIDLEGDAAVSAKLDSLISKIGVLTGSFSVSGGKAGDIISREQVDRISQATKGISGMKKEIQSLATSAAQGLSETGKQWLDIFTKKGGSAGSLAVNEKLLSMMSKEDREKIIGNQIPSVLTTASSVLKYNEKGNNSESMDDLSRRSWHSKGNSEIDKQASLAMQDFKINQKILNAAKFSLGKFILGAGTAMLNPWIGSRLLSDAIPKNGGGAGGKGGGTAAGIFGEGGAAGFAEFYVGIEVFKKSIDIFRSTIISSINKADKLYSTALQNGLGLGFSTKRGALAEIMGVSEQDVFRFGQQMAYLNPRIEGATKILSETAPGLAQASYNWKILKLDFEAVSAQIANALLPVINNLLIGLDGVAKWLQAHPDAFNQMAKMGAFGPSGGLINAAYGLLKPALNADNARMGMGAMPSPNSWMKQLPASSWERMGLQIGGGVSNYAKDTAKNTKDTAKAVQIIAKFVGGVGTFRGHGAGGSWGMSPTTAQP